MSQWIVTPDKFLTDEESKKLRRMCEEAAIIAKSKGNQMAVRNRLIIEMALGTGLRVSELANLKIDDIHIRKGQNSLTVNNGKGGKHRVVGFNNKLKMLIQEYLDYRKSMSSYLFASERGEKMTRDSYESGNEGDGSIIVILATDAPLLAHQMKRLARRIPMGIGKVGGYAHDGSGDIFIAFSTANPNVAFADKKVDVDMLPNWMISPLFEATVQAVEESIINVLCAAEDLDGINDNKVWALPHDRLKEVMKKYNRIN